MHPILARQLKRLLGAPADETIPWLTERLWQFLETHQAAPVLKKFGQGLAEFLGWVNDAYLQFDRDLELRTRSLKLSSQEFLDINDELRRILEAREAAMAQLQSLAERLQHMLPGCPGIGDGHVDSLTGLVGLIGHLIERQETHQTELQSLHIDLANQKSALDQHAIVSITDLDGNITYANDRFCLISGYNRDELLGKNHRIVKSGHHPTNFYTELWSTIQSGQVWRGEVKNRRKNGDDYWVSATIVPLTDPSGRPSQYISIRTDITERKRAEEALIVANEQAEMANRALQTANAELNRLATTDRLTGTWNRRHFEEVIESEMARVLRYGPPLSLLLFDIDHFKSINDRFGHLTGDRVLIEVTQRARQNLRMNDVLARWGGEEFVVMLPHCASGGAMHLAEKLRFLIATEPFNEVGTVTSSFGVAEYRPHESLDIWLKRADDALYQAKSEGRNTVRLGL